MSVTLLPPQIDKQLIVPSDFASLPPMPRMMASKNIPVWKVTISPRKSSTSGHCRVTIIAPANYRTGSLILENAGRQPAVSPPEKEDDLRPIIFYAFGTGSQGIKVVLQSNRNNYLETIIKF